MPVFIKAIAEHHHFVPFRALIGKLNVGCVRRSPIASPLQNGYRCDENIKRSVLVRIA